MLPDIAAIIMRTLIRDAVCAFSATRAAALILVLQQRTYPAPVQGHTRLRARHRKASMSHQCRQCFPEAQRPSHRMPPATPSSAELAQRCACPGTGHPPRCVLWLLLLRTASAMGLFVHWCCLVARGRGLCDSGEDSRVCRESPPICVLSQCHCWCRANSKAPGICGTAPTWTQPSTMTIHKTRR